MKRRHKLDLRSVVLALTSALALPFSALAHCDGMDGPVVQAARQALTTGDVNLVLIWVQERDESEIRQAFDRTLAVRTLGDDARALADTYFFETLVRVHRAGEGAAYTGLKPAGRNLGPAIPLADEALSKGNIGPVIELLTDALQEGLSKRFDHVMRTREHRGRDLEAGRESVGAYVAFIHYVERAYEAASQAATGHFSEDHDSPGGSEDHS